jgi:hypothetical protein
MSNTTQEYRAFMQLANADPNLHPKLLLVDGAIGGQPAESIRTPDAAYWTQVDGRLAQAGATRQQVQAVWLKQANARPTAPFPDSAQSLQADLKAIVRILHDRFPNLKLAYLSSRTYGGYASTALNPEPFAYESGFAVKWLIEAQINGDPELNYDAAVGPVEAPWLSWGPYLWADGQMPRSDGLTWACSDFQQDGTHPSPSGQQKVARMLHSFFGSDATTREWYLADPAATPLPTSAASDTPYPTQTSPLVTRPPVTPGTRQPPPTRQPGTPGTPGTPATPGVGPGLASFRVREVTGDEMWVTTTDGQLAARLGRYPAGQEMWLCGRVLVAANAEWGFVFGPNSLQLRDNVGPERRTTIRQISADPDRFAGTLAGGWCIQIQAVVASVSGVPPTAAPSDTPRPSGGFAYLPVLASRWMR